MSQIIVGNNVEFNEEFKKWHKSIGALHRDSEQTLSNFCNDIKKIIKIIYKNICKKKKKKFNKI